LRHTILLTGGIGFIGSTLAAELSQNGYSVIILDKQDNNKGVSIHKTHNNIKYIKGDISNSMLLSDVFTQNSIAGIIHLAAISRVITAENDPKECIRTNVNGFKTVLAGAQNSKHQIPWLIFGSSREVYGESEILPVTENFEKKFVNIYGDSKIQGEKLTKEYALKNDTSALILRFSNVYGNKFDIFDRVLPRFIKAISNSEELIIEGGGQLIDFTHIDDTVHAIIKAVEYIQKEQNVIDDFHVLPGVGWRLDQAIEYIEGFLNKKAKIRKNSKRKYDVEKFVGDPQKMKMVLKTRDFIFLKEGLAMSIPEYLEAMS